MKTIGAEVKDVFEIRREHAGRIWHLDCVVSVTDIVNVMLLLLFLSTPSYLCGQHINPPILHAVGDVLVHYTATNS